MGGTCIIQEKKRSKHFNPKTELSRQYGRQEEDNISRHIKETDSAGMD
jgi:hypothetical protein